MPSAAAELPTPDALREVLHALLSQGQAAEAIEVACRLLGRMHEHARDLELRLAQMLRQAYGRHSEKIDPRQLALLLE